MLSPLKQKQTNKIFLFLLFAGFCLRLGPREWARALLEWCCGLHDLQRAPETARGEIGRKARASWAGPQARPASSSISISGPGAPYSGPTRVACTVPGSVVSPMDLRHLPPWYRTSNISPGVEQFLEISLPARISWKMTSWFFIQRGHLFPPSPGPSLIPDLGAVPGRLSWAQGRGRNTGPRPPTQPNQAWGRGREMMGSISGTQGRERDDPGVPGRTREPWRC